MLPLAFAAVTFIAWLVRLEFKNNANATRQTEIEAFVDEELKDAKTERKDIKRAFYAHQGDTTIHHNEAMFREFEKGLDRRMNGIEQTLQKISDKLDRSPSGIHSTQG